MLLLLRSGLVLSPFDTGERKSRKAGLRTSKPSFQGVCRVRPPGPGPFGGRRVYLVSLTQKEGMPCSSPSGTQITSRRGPGKLEAAKSSRQFSHSTFVKNMRKLWRLITTALAVAARCKVLSPVDWTLTARLRPGV